MNRYARLLSGLGFVLALASPANADVNYTQGDGVTRNLILFDFICFTTKHCSAHVPINSAGTEIGTASTPFRTDPTGTTTQPVSAASWPLPTGAATSALQSSAAAAKGEGATGAAVPSGAQYGGMNIGGNLTGFAGISAGADGVSNTANQLLQGAFNYFYNGTTWDRVRGTTSGGMLVNVSNTLAAVGNNADGVAAGAGAASPVVAYNYVYNGTTWDRQKPSAAVLNPCETVAQSYAPISITSATTTRIVTPSASNKTYICGLIIVTGAANNVAIVEGTGGTCGTGTAGVIGGTTAANGSNFSANGGLVLQAGKTAHAQTAGTNVDLCVITSSVGPYSGGIKYVQAP